MSQNGSAPDWIAALFDGSPTDNIYPASQALLKILFQRPDLKKPRIASGQKFNEQIHIASRPSRATSD